MTAFDTPFAADGERREPTSTETSLGFPCGPADQRLFNELFHRLEGHVGEVIGFAGVVPTGPLTGLREAIEALINAATGGGDTSQFLLVTQARARLPIFPEVLNVDGKIGVSAPATGTIRLAGGVDFLHRGIFPLTTAQTDFATDPSKTYHLRWNPTDGFVLRDLASGTYNPTALAEVNAAFDSKYDDMLVARIITNSSNVATITTLANKQVLRFKGDVVGVPNTAAFPSGVNGAQFDFAQAINFARTPDFIHSVFSQYTDGPVIGASQVTDRDVAWASLTESRYQFGGTMTSDCLTGLTLRLLGIA